jgi:hypothetical protein
MYGKMSWSVEERIAARSVTDDGCLVWTGATSKKGYGHIRVANKTRIVHRLVWELAHGPLLPGQCVLHTCDNPPCHLLDHLFLGTKDINNKDMVAKGRHWNQRKTHCAHGHEYTPENTYVSSRGWRYCRTCHREAQQS